MSHRDDCGLWLIPDLLMCFDQSVLAHCPAHPLASIPVMRRNQFLTDPAQWEPGSLVPAS